VRTDTLQDVGGSAGIGVPAQDLRVVSGGHFYAQSLVGEESANQLWKFRGFPIVEDIFPVLNPQFPDAPDEFAERT